MNYLYRVYDSNSIWKVVTSRKSHTRVQRMMACEFFGGHISDYIQDMNDMGTQILYLGETHLDIGIIPTRSMVRGA
jgi:hypothetical protein